MAFIATVKILVDEAEQDSVYDGINEILRNAQYGGPNGEDRGWVVDWKFDSVEPANESLNDSISNETYAEGDAFNKREPAFEPFKLVVEAYATDGFGEGPSWAEVSVTPEFLQTLERLRRICQEENLGSVTVQRAPDSWDIEDELRIRNDRLLVCGNEFWFEADPGHAPYPVETRLLRIDVLAQVAKAIGSHGDHGRLPISFEIRNGIVFYDASDPGDLANAYLALAEE